VKTASDCDVERKVVPHVDAGNWERPFADVESRTAVGLLLDDERQKTAAVVLMSC